MILTKHTDLGKTGAYLTEVVMDFGKMNTNLQIARAAAVSYEIGTAIKDPAVSLFVQMPNSIGRNRDLIIFFEVSCTWQGFPLPAANVEGTESDARDLRIGDSKESPEFCPKQQGVWCGHTIHSSLLGVQMRFRESSQMKNLSFGSGLMHLILARSGAVTTQTEHRRIAE
jgi:hypothetical protein